MPIFETLSVSGFPDVYWKNSLIPVRVYTSTKKSPKWLIPLKILSGQAHSQICQQALRDPLCCGRTINPFHLSSALGHCSCNIDVIVQLSIRAEISELISHFLSSSSSPKSKRKEERKHKKQ